MVFVHKTYSKTRGFVTGLSTVIMIAAGFLILFFSSARMQGAALSFLTDVSGLQTAHADAPIDGSDNSSDNSSDDAQGGDRNNDSGDGPTSDGSDGNNDSQCSDSQPPSDSLPCTCSDDSNV